MTAAKQTRPPTETFLAFLPGGSVEGYLIETSARLAAGPNGISMPASLARCAPDLLAACKAVLAEAEAFKVHIGPEVAAALRTAIARAEKGGA